MCDLVYSIDIYLSMALRRNLMWPNSTISARIRMISIKLERNAPNSIGIDLFLTLWTETNQTEQVWLKYECACVRSVFFNTCVDVCKALFQGQVTAVPVRIWMVRDWSISVMCVPGVVYLWTSKLTSHTDFIMPSSSLNVGMLAHAHSTIRTWSPSSRECAFTANISVILRMYVHTYMYTLTRYILAVSFKDDWGLTVCVRMCVYYTYIYTYIHYIPIPCMWTKTQTHTYIQQTIRDTHIRASTQTGMTERRCWV
jgi:hypothetical protein